MSIPAWISIGIFLCVGKAIVAIAHTILWFQRRAKLSKMKKKPDGRFPFVPLLSWLLLCAYILLFTTASANIPGLAPCIFGIGWSIWATQALFFVYKFVSLGHRIAFVRGREMMKHEGPSLSKLDCKGKLSLLSAIIGLLGQGVCFCILFFVFPKSYTLIQVAFGLSAWCMSQIGFLLINHFERVIKVVSQSRKLNETVVSSETSKEMSAAVNKLREQQIGSFIPIFLAMIFYVLLSANVIPARYFIFPIAMLLETFGFLIILASNLKSQMRARRRGVLNTNSESLTTKNGGENREQMTAVVSSSLPQ